VTKVASYGTTSGVLPAVMHLSNPEVLIGVTSVFLSAVTDADLQAA
jgi:hypothetical protein